MLYAIPKPTKQKRVIKHRGPTEKQYLENRLDTLVSQYVILRDRGCVTPSATCSGSMTCSHYYARGKKRVRFDLTNCNCQCATHNGRHNHFTSYYTKYMLAHYGTKKFAELTNLANTEHWEWTVPELRQMVVDMIELISKTEPHLLPLVEAGFEK
jgi:hypothetical protein